MPSSLRPHPLPGTPQSSGPSFPARSRPRLPRSRAPAARLLSRPRRPLLRPAPLGSSPLPLVCSRFGYLLSRQSGQPSLSPAPGSGAEGPAGVAAMEAAARRRQHPGAAGGPGAQPGASFLQARWARAGGRSGTAAPPRDGEGVGPGPRSSGGLSPRYPCSCFSPTRLSPASALLSLPGGAPCPGRLSGGVQRPSGPAGSRTVAQLGSRKLGVGTAAAGPEDISAH